MTDNSNALLLYNPNFDLWTQDPSSTLNLTWTSLTTAPNYYGTGSLKHRHFRQI